MLRPDRVVRDEEEERGVYLDINYKRVLVKVDRKVAVG